MCYFSLFFHAWVATYFKNIFLFNVKNSFRAGIYLKWNLCHLKNVLLKSQRVVLKGISQPLVVVAVLNCHSKHSPNDCRSHRTERNCIYPAGRKILVDSPNAVIEKLICAKPCLCPFHFEFLCHLVGKKEASVINQSKDGASVYQHRCWLFTTIRVNHS